MRKDMDSLSLKFDIGDVVFEQGQSLRNKICGYILFLDMVFLILGLILKFFFHLYAFHIVAIVVLSNASIIFLANHSLNKAYSKANNKLNTDIYPKINNLFEGDSND